jgi:hypothetical protein
MPALELAAKRASVDLDARGETLDVEAFARMATELGPSLRIQTATIDDPE